jgi:hypothetical protein
VIDVVSMLVGNVQAVWAQWQVAGALFMDVQAVLPSVA